MLNKAYVNSFSLLPCMKPKCRQKFLTRTSAFVVSDLQLQYLQMSGNISITVINSGNFINNNFTLVCRNSKDWSHGGSQQNFIQGGSVPGSNPLPFYIPFLTEKVLLLLAISSPRFSILCQTLGYLATLKWAFRWHFFTSSQSISLLYLIYKPSTIT